jgi:hypothetical protein
MKTSKMGVNTKDWGGTWQTGERRLCRGSCCSAEGHCMKSKFQPSFGQMMAFSRETVSSGHWVKFFEL